MFWQFPRGAVSGITEDAECYLLCKRVCVVKSWGMEGVTSQAGEFLFGRYHLVLGLPSPIFEEMLFVFPTIRWRRKWQPIPVFLYGGFHGQRSLAGYSLCSCKESDATEWLTLFLWGKAPSWAGHSFIICKIWVWLHWEGSTIEPRNL